MPKEEKLPSGAVLRIGLSPFVQAKELFQAILKELRGVPILGEDETLELFKNMFSSGFSSKEVERLLWQCMERCTYGPADAEALPKITPESFEKEEARQDFIPACVLVAKENILPFLKGLYAEYKTLQPMLEGKSTQK